ncbi:MAG: hypothetical protein PHT00_00800 [Candidatus Methanomethylophilus sp.]|nr:hypothetical protein [Methanomethylophilus sp.]MDD4221536.1 hypothetical protein [Methanomethylophilus sp.]MDD4668366.1 hypothetical protein [Methanomethylophilus sp.]
MVAEIDGNYVDESGYVAYNYKVVKTMTSFAYTYSSGGSEYTQAADDGMKYVVVDMITKNVNYDDRISPTAGTIQCISDSNLSYGCDYVATEEYSGIDPFDYPDVIIGGSYSFILVFEIPEDAIITTVGYEYTGLYNWVLDTSLPV